MKRLTLTRRWYEDERTIGELWCDGEWVAFTMEPGGADTAAPRVADGFYHLVRHDDPDFKYDDTWALVGRRVSHQPKEGIARSAVLFHAGNWDEQTKGCILLGMTISHMRDETAVRASGDAMDRLRGFLGKAEAYLTIEKG
jgi:hypothetical protein